MLFCIILLSCTCWAALSPQQATDAFLSTLDSELKQSFNETIVKLQPILDQQPQLSSQIYSDLEPSLIQGFKPMAIQLFNSHDLKVSTDSFILQDPLHSELQSKWNQYCKTEIKNWVYAHMGTENSLNTDQSGRALRLASIVGVVTITVTFLVMAAAGTLALMTGMIIAYYKFKGVPIPGTKAARAHNEAQNTQTTNSLDPTDPGTYSLFMESNPSSNLNSPKKNGLQRSRSHGNPRPSVKKTHSHTQLHIRRDYVPLQ